MQMYYLMRLRCPELFCAAKPSENGKVFDLQAQCVLNDRDQFGQRVYVIRLGERRKI